MSESTPVDMSPESVAAREKLLSELDTLLDAEGKVNWQIGDLLITLTSNPYNMDIPTLVKNRYEKNGIVPRGRNAIRLRRIMQIAQKVKPEDRNYELPFTHYEMLFVQVAAVEQNVQKEFEGKVDYKVDVAAEIEELKKLPSNARGVMRELGKKLANKARNTLLPERHKMAEEAIAACPKELTPDTVTVNNCYHKDYAEVLAKLPDNSVQLLFCDPPYAQYQKAKKGKNKGALVGSSAAAKMDGVNMDEESAIRTTCEAFPIAAKKLRKNGVIVLWQAGKHLRMPILKAIDDAGFEVWMPIVWNKGRPQAGELSVALSLSIEFAWVIVRKGEKPQNINSKYRGQVYSSEEWPVPTMRATDIAEKHQWRKPMESNRDIMELFTSNGDLIVEAFGCEGTMSQAAIAGNRRWIYCEAFEENFKLGFTAIQTVLQKHTKPDVNIEPLIFPKEPDKAEKEAA